MENENLDLDTKPVGNKDLWLFLLTVDIVFLCIFGFFLYKNFAANVFQPASAPSEIVAAVAEEEIADAEDVVSVEAVEVQEMTAPAPANPEPEPSAVITVPVQEVPLTAVLEQKPEPKAEPVVAPQQAPVEEVTPKEQKESIVVVANPKSKYRKVTFRWFGEGNQVSIVSGFTMSKPQALKKQGDHWETTLSIAPGTYKFLFVVDGKNRKDPYSPEKDGRSVVEIK